MYVSSGWTILSLGTILLFVSFNTHVRCSEYHSEALNAKKRILSPISSLKKCAFIRIIPSPSNIIYIPSQKTTKYGPKDILNRTKSVLNASNVSKGTNTTGTLETRILHAKKVLHERLESLCKYVKETKIYRKICDSIERLKKRMNTLSLREQLALAALAQMLYGFVLPNFHILFPYQLFPTDSGLGVDIGMDTIVSIVFFLMFLKGRNRPHTKPSLTEYTKKKIPLVAACLLGTYFMSGYFALFVEYLLLLVSAADIPVSLEMHRSLRILMGHLFWVTIGSQILRKTIIPVFDGTGEWFKLNPHDIWVFKSLAGYFISCTLYGCADIVYQTFLKLLYSFVDYDTFEGENIVSQLTEGNDILATIIGAFGPCVTAPWWEEILYRVFVLRSLGAYLPQYLSVAMSSFLFAAHHLNLHSMLQLFTLGFVWSLLEQKVNNLFVTIVIHSLWNTRILLGGIFGF